MLRWEFSGDELSCPDPNLMPRYRTLLAAMETWVLARWESGASLRRDMEDCLLDAMTRVVERRRPQPPTAGPPANRYAGVTLGWGYGV